LRIYILTRGPLGEKVVNNLVKRGLADSIVGIHEYPEKARGLVDDLETIMPPDPPECDLLLCLFLHPDVVPVIPLVAQKTGAKEVLAPVDDWHLMPEGLKRQISGELDEIGVAYEFPKPFCQLETSSHPLIGEIAEKLGKPKFEADVKLGSISKVRILRDTPCGSAQFVADKLAGIDTADYREKASRAHLDYPCLAGMDRDPILKTEIMQVATECLCEEVRRALEEAEEESGGD
jgi:hypothetical protein